MDEDYIIELFKKNSNSPTPAELETLTQTLSVYINNLLLHDFNKLIHILYRVDISEGNLKKILKDNHDTDSSIVIAELIIKRQLEKGLQKNKHKFPGNIPEDEKW